MQKVAIIMLVLLINGCTYVQAYREGYEHATNFLMYPDECGTNVNLPLSERFKRLGCIRYTAHHADYALEPKGDIDFCKANQCLHLPFYKGGYDWAAEHAIDSIAQCGTEDDKYFSINEYLFHLGCHRYLVEYPEKIMPLPADDPGPVRTSAEGLEPITEESLKYPSSP